MTTYEYRSSKYKSHAAYLWDDGRDTDAEVNVEAIADLAGGALRNLMAPIQSGLLRVSRLLLLSGARGQFCHLNRLGLGGLHDTVDIDTRDVDGVRRQASDWATTNCEINYECAQVSAMTYTISSASTMVSFAFRAMTPL